MTTPCEQEDNIRDIQETNRDIQGINKDILRNQEMLASQHIDLVQKLDGFFSRLEAILLADVERRKDVDQLTKDVDTLFDDNRAAHAEIEHIKERNARCDGAGIFENFPQVWNWYQQERGWRRMMPGVMTVLTFLLAVYITFGPADLKTKSIEHTHNIGQNSETYGIPLKQSIPNFQPGIHLDPHPKVYPTPK